MTVHFVGAGPGAADLITVRAQRLLSQCSACLYAGSLVPAEVLAHCPPDATLTDTAASPWTRSSRQWSKPTRRARTWSGCAPGTRPSSAPSPSRPAAWTGLASRTTSLRAFRPSRRPPPSCAVSCTVPGVGQTVVLTRIAQRATPMPPGEDLASLGATGATLVLHLAVQRVEQVVAELLPHYGSDCPAAVVAYASQENEVVLRGTLGDIAVQVLAAGVKRTAVIIVGKVLAAEGFRDSHLYSAARDRSSHLS